MPDTAKTYRVLVAQAPYFAAASEVTRYVWEQVTAAQHAAYISGAANWRTAKAEGWGLRTWHRLMG